MRSDFGLPPVLQALSVIVPVLVVGFFAFIIGAIIVTTVKNLRQPLITRPARVVAKRTAVSGGGQNSSASSHYYVTFEFDSGSREEWAVADRQYALLAEGDVGTLRSQGTWFKGFDRLRS